MIDTSKEKITKIKESPKKRSPRTPAIPITVTKSDIWHTLRNVDIDPHIESKGSGGFKADYLNYTTTEILAKNEYPDITVEFNMFHQADGTVLDCMFYPDGSASVACTITICGHEFHQTGAVMNHMFKSIINPTSRDIQDAKARCEAKCYARAGLGTKLWVKDDPMTRKLPEGGVDPSHSKNTSPAEASIPTPGTFQAAGNSVG